MQYQQELPELGKLMAETGGDPEKLLSAPVRTFSSPQIQKQYLDTLQSAAETKQGILLKQRLIGQIKIANDIINRGGELPQRLQDGTYDPAQLTAAMNDVISREENAKLKEIGARNAWHATTQSGMSSPERRANALKRARQDLVVAIQSGDDTQIEEAQTFLDDLQKAISLEHKDPVEQTQLNLIRQTINQIDKDLGNPVMKEKWPELQKRRDEKQRELDNWGKVHRNPEPASQETLPPEPPKKVGEFKILRTIR